MRNPECPFGAVLVDSQRGEVVAEGVNRTTENPTWHGKMDAIHNYSKLGTNKKWRHMYLYTTAGPCRMCQGAIIWAEISVVIYGTSIARLEQMGWDQIKISADEVVHRATFAR